MAATTVLVVDDHAGFRACARRLLEREGYQVVAEAEDGMSAVEFAEELHPQVALVDVYLPDIDGFEVASRLALLDGGPAIVMISSRARAEFEAILPDSGVRGFVPKDELSRTAIEALL